MTTRHPLPLCALLALLVPSLACSAATIPDEPVAAIEPGLEMDDRVGGALAWLDDHTLLVTAQRERDSPFWDHKVMQVNARTGQAKALFPQGSVACTNPTDGVAGILVGSKESLYTGHSKQPKPELKFFGWNALFGSLTPKASPDGWNALICKKTRPEDTQTPGFAFVQRDIRYLLPRHGHLDFSQGRSLGDSSVALVRNDKPVTTLAVKQNEIAPDPQYLPFRDVYLLSSGRFVMNSTMVRPNEAPTTEFPILTMTPAGQVKREHLRPLFQAQGFVGDGDTFPYAQGTLILVGNRPQHGGGIYLNQGQALRRIWCTNAGNTYDRQCGLTAMALSPDGCRLAFFAKGSDHARSVSGSWPALMILPLCR